MSKKQKVLELAALGFKLKGKTFVSGSIPSSVSRAVAALEKLPFKEVVTTEQLAGMVGVQRMYFSHLTSHSLLSPYKYSSGKSNQGFLWGSVRTMRELKRQLETE